MELRVLRYFLMAAREEKEAAKVQEKVTEETGAAELTAEGDKAFTEGDYESAKVYYAMALDKYQKLEDTQNAELLDTKLAACVKKSGEKEEQREIAEAYEEEARQLEEAGDLAEAKKKYLMAKDIYRELQDEDRAGRTENRIDMLDVDAEEERRQEAGQQAGQPQEIQDGATVSGNSSG